MSTSAATEQWRAHRLQCARMQHFFADDLDLDDSRASGEQRGPAQDSRQHIEIRWACHCLHHMPHTFQASLYWCEPFELSGRSCTDTGLGHCSVEVCRYELVRSLLIQEQQAVSRRRFRATQALGSMREAKERIRKAQQIPSVTQAVQTGLAEVDWFVFSFMRGDRPHPRHKREEAIPAFRITSVWSL